MELEELLKKLAEHPADAVAEKMQNLVSPVWQKVFNKGHSVATEKAKQKETELEGKVNEISAKLKEAETQAEELRSKAPDLAKLQADYANKVRALEEKHREDLSVRDNALIKAKRDAVLTDLRRNLSTKLEQDYVLTRLERSDMAKRIKVDADGKVEFLQEDGVTPIIGSKDKDELSILAEEIITKAPNTMKLSNMDRGGNASNGDGGGSGKTKDKYDKIREEVKAKQAATARPTPNELGKRLGHSTTTV